MKSVDKFDHPDFVGGVVWSSLELDWIRNRDAEWEQQLAACQQELQTTADALGHTNRDIERLERESSACDMVDDLRKQLATTHANELRLREAHEAIAKLSLPIVSRLSKAALAACPGDTSALREVCARVIFESNERDSALMTDIEELRSGEWTPEALR